MNTIPTTENRIWAFLSHLSTLLLGMGILLPVIGWSDQRRKSNYASFQALQALGYQSLGFTIWILSYLVIAILIAIILLILTWNGEGSGVQDPALTPWFIAFSIILSGSFVLYLLLPIIAAIACALGKDFRYPILGNRLARYLAYDPLPTSEEQVWLNENNELRWVAACGHFSVLILIWGMLAPLTAWMLHGKRSLFLKFQSIQTLVYQAVVTVLFFVGLFLYAAGLLGLVAAFGGFDSSAGGSAPGIAGMVITVGIMAIGGLIILAVPLFHILGQWAGYRILKGENYHYPLLGRWIYKRISRLSEGN
jgi:uncharacterized Tic20 family protein